MNTIIQVGDLSITGMFLGKTVKKGFLFHLRDICRGNEVTLPVLWPVWTTISQDSDT